MIAVIFEVIPKAEHFQEYLDIEAGLKPLLQDVEGFISIERFQSLNEPKKVLSLSFWTDEAAVRQWRNNPDHRIAQATGRQEVFENYTLHIAAVIRHYGMFDRAEAPADSHIL